MRQIVIPCEHHVLLGNPYLHSFLKDIGLRCINDHCKLSVILHEWVFEHYFMLPCAYRLVIEDNILTAIEHVRQTGSSEALSYLSKTSEVKAISYNDGCFRVEYVT